MPERLSYQSAEAVVEEIGHDIEAHGVTVFTRTELGRILAANVERWKLPSRFSVNKLIELLSSRGQLSAVLVHSGRAPPPTKGLPTPEAGVQDYAKRTPDVRIRECRTSNPTQLRWRPG